MFFNFKLIILISFLMSTVTLAKPIEFDSSFPSRKRPKGWPIVDAQFLDTTSTVLQLEAGKSHLIKLRLGSQFHDLFKYMPKISLSVSADLKDSTSEKSLQVVDKTITDQDVVFGPFLDEPLGWYIDLDAKFDIPTYVGGMYQLRIDTYAIEVVGGMNDFFPSYGKNTFILIDNPQPELVDMIGPQIFNVNFEKTEILQGEPILLRFQANDKSPICHDGMTHPCKLSMLDRHVLLNPIEPLSNAPSINDITHKIESLGEGYFRLVIPAEAYGQNIGVFSLEDFYLYDDKGNLGKWRASLSESPRILISNNLAP